MKRKDRTPRYISLRLRLVLLVALELVGCTALAVWIMNLLDKYLVMDWDVPLLVILIIICLVVGSLVTGFLSRLFFHPIQRLRQAMAKVGKGDFTTTLDVRGSSREIQEIYTGFNRMTQQLRSTEILQTDFVTNVSHEFKTPLNAIEGYSMLLQDCDNLTPEQRGYVDKIVFNTQRLSSLAGGILLLSKLENQGIPTNQSRYSLDEQIRQTIVALEKDWEQKDLELDVELPNCNYYGCEHLMGHVWQNLLSNAVKFSPQGGCVRIRLENGVDSIQVSIRDQGPGIEEDAMEHIFDKFYQADSSHKQEGNGLGLALVDKILKLEGGTIRAENCPDGGCRFVVILEKR